MKDQKEATFTSEDGRTFKKVPGRCCECAASLDRELCEELPGCRDIIGPEGEPVEVMWKEVRQ